MRIKEGIYTLGCSCLIIFVFFWAYAMFWPPKVAQFPKIIPAQKNIVKPGETIPMKLKYCIKKDARMLINKQLVNVRTGEEYLLPGGERATLAGCVEKTPNIIIIPPETKDGRYKVYFQRAIEINKWRTVYVSYESTEFEVRR